MRACSLPGLGACVLLFALGASACKGKPAPPAPAPPAPAPPETSHAEAASARPPSPLQSAKVVDAAVADATSPPGDGATSSAPQGDAGLACALLTGPVSMPFKRHGALVASGDGVDAVFNDGGTPHVVHVAKTARPKPDQGSAEVTVPPCAVTATHFYCPDADGAVHRVPRGGGDGSVVAHVYKDTRVDAVSLEGGHELLAFVQRTYSEQNGFLTVAKAMLDDAPAVRLDENGATDVSLALRGGGAVAVMVDARAALTLVHARVLTPAGGALTMGEDTALYVGGASKEGPPHPAIATTNGGRMFALLAADDDAGKVGMATIVVDDPPKIDEPSLFVPYPSARGRLSLDATRGASRATVGRVRSNGEEHGAPVVLELGRLDPEGGAFRSLGLEPTDGDARDVALAEDSDGDLWLLVTDHTGSFVERRRCP